MGGVARKPYAYGGLAVLLVVAWAVATAGGALIHGHPSYWVFYVGAVALGASAVVLGVVWRGRSTRWWLSLLATTGLIVTAVLSWWVKPFEVTGLALDALESDGAVVVTTSTTEITMTPVGSQTGVGLIFQPGARVDARAYAHILRPIAEAGYQVVIAKQPLGIAFLASGFAPDWAADHPSTARWVAAGHSLGGVVAVQNAADSNEIMDVVLWASFPGSDLSGGSFNAASIFGTSDGLTTIADIDDSRSELPPRSVFVAVEGAIHSHFGDYGSQPGDGEPRIPRDEAQAQIVAATLAFLAR